MHPTPHLVQPLRLSVCPEQALVPGSILTAQNREQGFNRLALAEMWPLWLGEEGDNLQVVLMSF